MTTGTTSAQRAEVVGAVGPLPDPSVGERPELARPTYAAEIDGLRAVAVLAVLGYHAFPTIVQGGYIGVDVFFVISGYLICGIIFASTLAGTFSFTDFYVRRINRIFPALSVILLACLVAGWMYLLPDEYAQLRRHVSAGALFVANYTLNQEAGYWDTRSELKPLLHLWSLAVEEQFYLLFPLAVVVFARIRLPLVASALGLAALSFAWNLARVTTNGSDAFFLPQTRFWELLLGGMLAYVGLSGNRMALRVTARPSHDSGWITVVANCACVLGFIEIIGGFLLMDRQLAFPGYWALVPTTGALLIIAGGRRVWLNRVVLSHPVAVWFGLISYPLYLWHWPLLAFIRMFRNSEDDASVALRLAALMLSVGLAWLTYRFVEKPIRNRPRRRQTAALLFPLILVVATIAGIDRLIPARSLPPEIVKLIGNRSDGSPWGELKNITRISGADRTAIFIGDSHADQYKARIARLAAEDSQRTRSAMFFVKGSCLPIPHVKRTGDQACEDEINIKEARAALAANRNIDTVVLSALWSWKFQYMDERFENAGLSQPLTEPAAVEKAFLSLEEMLTSFKRDGKRLFVILDNPVGGVDPRALIVRHLSGFFSVRPLSESALTKQSVLTGQEPTRTRLIGAARRAGATIIDPVEFLCGALSCPIVTETGYPIYWDSNHLRRDFVREHARYIDDIMTQGMDPSGPIE